MNFRQSKLSKSFENYFKCLELSKKINNRQYLGDSKIAIGKIYNQYGKNNLALGYCNSGLKIANEIGSLSLKKEACDCLYEGYKAIYQEYVEFPKDENGDFYQAGVFYSYEACALGFRRGGKILNNMSKFVGHIIK